MVIAVAMSRDRNPRSTSVLDDWAWKNGFQILSVSQTQVVGESQHQAVYLIRVRDQIGLVHSGWARCGSRVLGLSRHVDVEWDE